MEWFAYLSACNTVFAGHHQHGVFLSLQLLETLLVQGVPGVMVTPVLQSDGLEYSAQAKALLTAS